jgi:hypothetical protein
LVERQLGACVGGVCRPSILYEVVRIVASCFFGVGAGIAFPLAICPDKGMKRGWSAPGAASLIASFLLLEGDIVG